MDEVQVDADADRLGIARITVELLPAMAVPSPAEAKCSSKQRSDPAV
jgi:hypothetical protein